MAQGRHEARSRALARAAARSLSCPRAITIAFDRSAMPKKRYLTAALVIIAVILILAFVKF
jgi:hypothetical protein